MDLLNDLLGPDTLWWVANGYWLALAFALGAAVGSFINVIAARLPLEKSLLWPSSRCGACLKPIRLSDNIPIISYLRLRGRCRSCGARFSSSYLWVELGTALGFAGLFAVEVIANVHRWPTTAMAANYGMHPWWMGVGWGYHALLFTLLVAASVCDLRTREIPLPLTLTGTVLGLIGAVAFPWPCPHDPALVRLRLPPPGNFQVFDVAVSQGFYAWPFWLPLPEWFAPGGNWQTGLATGVAGALAGTFLMRGIGFLFGTGLGKEALGLGDADLMMMAGAFLGWQLVLVALVVSLAPALLFGFYQVIVHDDNSLPYGPSLAIGLMTTALCWRVFVESVPAIPLFFLNGTIALAIVGASAGFLLLSSFVIRLMRS